MLRSHLSLISWAKDNGGDGDKDEVGLGEASEDDIAAKGKVDDARFCG